MKRFIGVIITIVLLSSSLWAAPWLGGYRLSFDGYEGQEGQYYGVHLYVEPVWGTNLGLGFAAGGSTSFGLSSPSSQFEASAEIHALSVETMLFRRPSQWRIALSGGISTDFDSYHYWGQIDPFVFFFGEKTVKVLGLRLLDDRSWAIRLLEITHYFF
ncbi:MAG: hypothetical protein WC954_06230 [Sphaerochaeta sp.]